MFEIVKRLVEKKSQIRASSALKEKPALGIEVDGEYSADCQQWLPRKNSLFSSGDLYLIAKMHGIAFWKCANFSEPTRNIGWIGYEQVAHGLGFKSTECSTLAPLAKVLSASDYLDLVSSVRSIANNPNNLTQKVKLYRAKSVGGEVIFLEIAITTFYDEADDAKIALLGSIRDVSRQQCLQEKLDITQARFDFSRDLIEDGLWDTAIPSRDAGNPLQHYWWSPQMRRLLGYEIEDEFPAVLESWSSRLHEEDKGRVFEAYSKHLNDKTDKTPYDIEYRIKKKDGSYTWFRARCKTQRSSDGDALRVFGSVTDISMQKREAAHYREQMAVAAQTAENVRAIGSIGEIIGRLSQQSTLLGMNASVEAARAGSSGRGFSVLATEIRKLSDQIAESAKEIVRLKNQISR